jgi:hypothetical protein
VVGVLFATGGSKRGNVMDTAQLIVNVLGFGILGWVIYGMKQRLNTQASILDEQNKMFEGAKVFLDFANPKNLKEVAEDIVALKEERMKEEMEKGYAQA